jgi:hypothetical protein
MPHDLKPSVQALQGLIAAKESANTAQVLDQIKSLITVFASLAEAAAGTETKTVAGAATTRTKKLSEDPETVTQIGKPAAKKLDEIAERHGTNKIGELTDAQKQAIKDRIAARRSAGS